MSGKVKRKAETVPAARDREEAEAFLSRIGEIQRSRAIQLGAIAAAIAEAKAATEARLLQLDAEENDLSRGLQLWAEANRRALTEDGRTKTVKLGAGVISWRQSPPSVRIRKQEDVLAFLQDNDREEFLRRKVEIDKSAMLGNPEAASEIPGVSIASSGEEFVIEPAGSAEAGR